MTERNYFQLSPVELNEEFRVLCKQLRPDFLGGLLDDRSMTAEEGAKRWRDILESRDRSEHKLAFMAILGGLLERSQGSGSFKKYISSRFSTLYNYGHEDGESIEGDSEFLKLVTDSTELESGGIFDESRVRFLEYLVYCEMLRSKIHISTLMTRAVKYQSPSVEKLLDENVLSWMKDFKKHYPNRN